MDERRAPRSTRTLALLLVLATGLFAGLIALGIWQLERRVWKLALIDRVAARIHAAPVDAPDVPAWRTVDAAHDAYRRVRASGYFLNDRATLVQAVTRFGAGHWAIVPLVTPRFTVLVNRGFVGMDVRAPAPVTGPRSVTGLLRITEPGGGFLHRNDPPANLWYSRDVAAIARARGLRAVAPYFIDADADQGPRGDDVPVGGLTTVRFANNHLVYAVTWFVLAAMVAAAAVALVRQHRR